jgi:uncharacterized protein (DUF1330 family)
MSVYFIVQEEITDPAGMEAYGAAAGPTLASFDCKPLAVDDDVQTVEGEWHGTRTVVLEFPTEEEFRRWYDSPAYSEARKLRFAASDSRGALVKGLG